MAEFASKGVAGTALGLGIAGTVGLVSQMSNNGCGNNGLFGGLFNNGCNDNSNCPITRYEQQQFSRIAELETEVKLRDANFYTISQISDLRNYVDGRFDETNKVLATQAVFNATQTGVINQINTQVQTLLGITKTVVPNSAVCPGKLKLARLCSNIWGNILLIAGNSKRIMA